MGQTLTHGVYLPDEGERNCYNGLAANWQILDGSVGTIAAHTAALAGKAPAVHTHTKSDITDFPAYGTAAGTICEGNDSRLSDARTPVAHTHTKADVTDLLNSNFIPSANNTYDLGSSAYQWNNLYAKNYFYNGVAWGLDKANTWSQDQEITKKWPALTLQDTVGVRETTPEVIRHITIHFNDKNGNSYGFINRQHKDNTGTHLHQVSINNGTYDYRLQFYLYTNGNSDFMPSNNGVINLGTSTNKWKTLNGVNPGALSLPDKPGGSGTVNVNYFDLSGNVTVKDGSTYNSYTALCDGWIVIGSFASEISIEDDTTNLATTAVPKSNGYAQAYLPVRQGDTVRITINQTNTQYQNFKLIPCQGNV